MTTLRAILAEHDPEFLAALREWHRTYHKCGINEVDAEQARLDLADVIERANLHAPTGVQAPVPLPAMYLGKEAFDDDC